MAPFATIMAREDEYRAVERNYMFGKLQLDASAFRGLDVLLNTPGEEAWTVRGENMEWLSWHDMIYRHRPTRFLLDGRGRRRLRTRLIWARRRARQQK